MSNVVLVTGVMGSGKTLKVVADLVNDMEANESRPVDEKRTYYSDITGLRIENVLPSPQDWRDTPSHSYIIYDEAQLNPMFARKRGQSHISVQELTLSRKRGHKIVFITQAPNRLHQDILDVVGEHYHLHRPYGAKLATCYMWRNMVALRPMSRDNQAKCESKALFTYPKKCYDLYDSSQVQDDGFRLKISFRGIAPALGFGSVLLFCAYFFYWGISSDETQSMLKGEDVSKTKQQTTQNIASAPTPQNMGEQAKNNAMAINDMLVANTPITVNASAPVVEPTPQKYQHLAENQILELNRLSYVLQIKGKCVGGNSIGEQFDITQQECKDYIKGKKRLIPSYVHTGRELLTEPQQIAESATLPSSVLPASVVGGV